VNETDNHDAMITVPAADIIIIIIRIIVDVMDAAVMEGRRVNTVNAVALTITLASVATEWCRSPSSC